MGTLIRRPVDLHNGEADLERSRHIGTHQVLAPGRTPRSPAATVACLTLDTWLARLGIGPDAVTFVKIDTQGWDAHVMMGGRSLLAARHVVWQIELSPGMMARAGVATSDLLHLLAGSFNAFQPLEPRQTAAVPIDALGDTVARVTAADGFIDLLLFNV